MAQHRDRAEEPSAPASLSEGFWGRLWILAEDVDAPFLGEVPLVQSIREAGDAGRPAVLQGDSPAAAAFRAVLANLLTKLGKNTD